MKSKFMFSILTILFVINTQAIASTIKTESMIESITKGCKTSAKTLIEGVEAKKNGYGYYMMHILTLEYIYSVPFVEENEALRQKNFTNAICKAVESLSKEGADSISKRIDNDFKLKELTKEEIDSNLEEAKKGMLN